VRRTSPPRALGRARACERGRSLLAG